jgi:hypothetical protein
MVRPEPPCLSILVLTEDSGGDGGATIIAIVRKTLLFIKPQARLKRVVLEPQSEDARRAMHGTHWKSKKALQRQKLILLGRVIAAKLLEEEGPGFVFFHVDGDRAWADRASSDAVEEFELFVQNYVKQALDNNLRRKRREHGESVDEESLQRDIEAALGRMLRLTPFYSIEAWLYQNTAEARKLCETHCGKHLSTITDWEQDRGQLDEVLKPKRDDFSCLGARHNRALAENGFPAQAAFDAGKSYAHAVLAMLDNKELTGALACTYS